jgi:hypothetical protein
MTSRTPVTKLPEPDLGQRLISKDRYLSRAYLASEYERLWPRVWNLVGPVSDVAEAGDYLVFDLGSESRTTSGRDHLRARRRRERRSAGSRPLGPGW